MRDRKKTADLKSGVLFIRDDEVLALIDRIADHVEKSSEFRPSRADVVRVALRAWLKAKGLED